MMQTRLTHPSQQVQVHRRRMLHPRSGPHRQRTVRVQGVFENFSEHSIRCIILAQQEARLYDAQTVMSEHLFAGIVEARQGQGSSVRGYMGDPRLEPKTIQRGIETAFGTMRQSGSSGSSGSSEVLFHRDVREACRVANDQLERFGAYMVMPEILFLTLLERMDERIHRLLEAMGVEGGTLRKTALEAVRKACEPPPRDARDAREATSVGRRQSSSSNQAAYSECCRDLTEMAREGAIDPVVGRSVELERVIQILSRRMKNNACLIGEAGVGKTAIAEGLAHLMAGTDKSRPCPWDLQDKRLMQLDITSLLAGTAERGELERRMVELMKAIEQDGDVILMIDEIHMMVAVTESNDGSKSTMANILKPALARGRLQCIGATTLDEYRRYIEGDPALERRFQPVYVGEPSPEEAVQIVQGASPLYAAYHACRYTQDALRAAVTLSVRYLPDRKLPDKAIDLVDEAGSRARVRKQAEVDVPDIEAIVSEWTGIPVQSKLEAPTAQELLLLPERLNARVIGQPAAVAAVSSAIQRSRVGLRDAKRPVASMLFVGMTGVGKTELAKVLAREYYGSESALIRLDMSEYMEAFSVSRLVGAPPGYVGYEDGGKLTEAVRRNPYCIVLFDEIEKAHPDVYNILLQILEDGRLSDTKGRVVSFKNAIVLLTSNVGTRMAQTVSSGAVGMALAAGAEGAEREARQTEAVLLREVTSYFRPELVNRFDEIVAFRTLSREDLARVAEAMLDEVRARLAAMGYRLELTQETLDRILEEGYSREYGARPLRRAITQFVEDRLADVLLDGTPSSNEGGQQVIRL